MPSSISNRVIGLLLVGAGGFLGSIARYLLSSWVHRILDNPWFPYGTLIVNVTGSFIIGFLAGLAETRSAFNSAARLFLFIGVLGGFTTFSSFALETLTLARNTQFLGALINVSAQLVLGLIAVWLGYIVAQVIWSTS
jgi:fluoride exporter